MTVEIKVPDMGESVIEATIARWMKQEGERVAAGEPVVELETDKINLEVGAQQAGVLQHITKQAGETVAVGDVLALVGEAEEGAAAAAAPAAAAAGTDGKPAPAEQPVPAAQAEQPATAQGVPASGTGAQGTSAQAAHAPVATPVAQRMAQEKGIDLARVTPTGPGGRITKEDVEAYLRKPLSEAPDAGKAAAAAKNNRQPEPQIAPVKTAAPAREAQQPPEWETAPVQAPSAYQPPAPRPVPSGGQTLPSAPSNNDRETRVRLSRRRQTIAHRLVEAQHTAAMLTTFNEVDMSAVMNLRKRRREEFKERYGVDLGFMSFFVKASIGALKAFPNVNSELISGPQGEELVLKHYYDIGIAIGAEEGLVVPVVRDADRLNFAGIEKAIRAFVDKVKNGTLTIEDLRGGTFTITNGGVYGSLMSTPILNPPQVGILGMHAIKERPIVVNGEIAIRPMMYLALSYDHRVVDGREAVQFLVRIKELVEDPEALLFG